MSAIGLTVLAAALSACGQKGALFLPTDPAAKSRATLPEVLMPSSGRGDGASTPSRDPPAQGTEKK